MPSHSRIKASTLRTKCRQSDISREEFLKAYEALPRDEEQEGNATFTAGDRPGSVCNRPPSCLTLITHGVSILG